MDKPKSPPKLGPSGRKLWREITESWELNAPELTILAGIARQLDDIAALESVVATDGPTVLGSSGQPRLHPALAEIRQARLAASRMLSDLKLPTDVAEPARSQASEIASHAARTRWALDAERKGTSRG